MACHGPGAGCTAIGADDACGNMWMASVGAAVMGSPSVGVIVASPWTVGRRWWPPCRHCPGGGGLGDRVEADGLEPRCDFVPSECAVVDRPFPWQVPKPVAVRGGAVLLGELHCGDGPGGGLCAGAFLCGWWGWCLGHLFVRLLWGFRLLQFCADGGEDICEDGGGGGVGCRIVPGHVVLLRVPGALLYGDCGGGVVFRCPSVWIVVEGVEGDGVAVFPALER